ncbi:MAG: hypothetical protein V1857_00905 [archaeon]
MRNAQLRRNKCGTEHSTDSNIYKCPSCEGSPGIEYNYDALAKKINRDLPASRPLKIMWRYAEVMPVSSDHIVTLGECFRPLIRAMRLGKYLGMLRLSETGLHVPTGSFKDLASSLLMCAREAIAVIVLLT